jgi:betaine reductase
MRKHSKYKFTLKEGRRNTIMAILDGKKVVIIGDRDGVPGPAIAECVKTAGGEIVYSSTECFV